MLLRIIGVFMAMLVYTHNCGQTLGFSLADGRKRVEIPIEIHNNLVVVPVLLNGVLPLKFIVDTGVRTAIVTQKVYTDILNLSYSRKYTIAGPGGEKLVEAYITNGVDLQLPGVDGHGHAVLVLEEDYLELRNYLGTDVHGILGYELFSRFIVKINYQTKKMTLMLPEKLRSGKKFELLPITIEDTKPYVHTEVLQSNGTTKKLKLLVDSGASHSILLEPSSDSTIVLPENTSSCTVGRGLGGEIRGKTGRLKSLRLGQFMLSNVIANYPDPNSYTDTLKMGNVFCNGSIGGEILNRFTIIYDFSSEKLYLKKNAHYRKGFYYNLSGLTLRAKGVKLNEFEVTDVRPGSCSDRAGIMEGDQIMYINDHPANNLNLNQINGMLNIRPGKKVNLMVERGESTLKIRLTLDRTSQD